VRRSVVLRRVVVALADQFGMYPNVTKTTPLAYGAAVADHLPFRSSPVR
jgi:hypothetical protein